MKVVIIEFGSTLRCGFSGELKPRYVTSSSYLFPRTQRRQGGKPLSYFLFSKLYLLFMDILHVKPKDSRVLVVENAFTPKVFRDALYHSLFIDLKVQSISFQPDLLMPLLATGSLSGLVIDIDHFESRSMAIVDGRPIYNSLRTTPVGVVHAFRRFCKEFKSINQEVPNIHIDDILMREIFEKAVLYNSVLEVRARNGMMNTVDSHLMSLNVNSEEVPLKIPEILRSSCLNELLRGLQLDGKDESEDEIGGIIGVVNSTLRTCSTDVIKIILKHSIFYGSGTVVPGIMEKVCSEVEFFSEEGDHKNANALKTNSFWQETSSKTCRFKVAFKSTPYNPYLLSWIGGSIFASLKSHETRQMSDNRGLKCSVGADDDFQCHYGDITD